MPSLKDKLAAQEVVEVKAQPKTAKKSKKTKK
jgi:hypothetical protein